MATLYVRDVPDELYQQLKKRAHEEGRSLTAETVKLLEQALHGEERRRSQRELLDAIQRGRRFNPASVGAPSSTEMLREDRAR